MRGEQSWLKEMSTRQDALARDPWIHVIITEANLLIKLKPSSGGILLFAIKPGDVGI